MNRVVATGNPWTVLDLAPTGDTRAIRSAYARRLKAIDPDADPAAFVALRAARDAVLRLATASGVGVGCDETGRDEANRHGAVAEAAGPPPAPPRPAPAGAGRTALPDHPAPDHFARDALVAMLSGEDAPDAAALAGAAERVLQDPAMAGVDHAMATEAMLAELIVRASPRSDPIIEPVVRFFGWAARADTLHRPPIIAWILQRAADRRFEEELPDRSPHHARLLAGLRAPPPSRGGAWGAWWHGVEMEYLIACLRSLHPTVLRGLDEEHVAWWSTRIERQHRLPPPIRWWRESSRRAVWQRGLETPSRRAAWRELAALTHVVLGPVALICLVAGAILTLSDHLARPTLSALDPVAGPAPMPPAPAFASFERDAAEPLSLVTGGAIDVPALVQRNPALLAMIRERWEAARTAGDADRFRRDVAHLLTRTLGAALRGQDAPLIADHAMLVESRLRWALRAGDAACAKELDGTDTPVAPDVVATMQRLIARAVLDGAVPSRRPRGHASLATFAIPPAVFADALTRSGLAIPAFRTALMARGPVSARCTARIALIDAAVSHQPGGGTVLLRDLFAPTALD